MSQFTTEFYNFLTEGSLVTILLLVTFTSFLVYLIFDERRMLERKYPHLPRPWSFPVVGNLPQLGQFPHKALTKFGKTFGDVFAVRLGSWDVLVLNSLSAAKEALFQKSAHFSSRPPFFTLRLRNSQDFTVAFGTYNRFQIERKKALLQAFHRVILTNPEHLNRMVSQEASRLSQILQSIGQSPFDPRACLKMVISRMVYRLTFGGSVRSEEEHDLYQLSKTSREFQESTSLVLLADFMPWMKFAVKRQMKQLDDLVGVLEGFVLKAYRRRKLQNVLEKEDYCTAKNIENFMKSLKRQEKMEKLSSHKPESAAEDKASEIIVSERKDVTKDEFTAEEEEEIEMRVVHMLASDAFGAGLENTSNLLSWSVAYIASYKELQQDLHAEIDRVIGSDEPCVQHKQRMPLMQAAILETLRLSSVIPMGIPHYCIQDSVVRGYHVAKGTIVLTNIWGINHDDRYFSHPECFEPYRFLDRNGQLRADRCSLVIPFNTGPRSCPGNAVTKTILFLLLSSLLQRYELQSEKNLSELQALPGPVLSPDFFEIVFRPREMKSTADA